MAVNTVPGSLDPAAIAEAVREVHEDATSRRRDLSFEIYRRVAQTIRVGVDSGGEILNRTGRDDGLAVRVFVRTSKESGFAATGGWGAGPVGWAIERAIDSRLEPRGEVFPPAGPIGGTADIESDLRLPSPSRLRDWIVPAVAELRERASGAFGTAGGVRGWVEAGLTVEVIAGAAGQWVRGRNRVWAALLGPARGLPDAIERPRVLVAKRLELLRAPDWETDFECPASLSRTPAKPALLPILVDSEASSALIQGVVAARMSGWIRSGAPTGSGWVLSNDPGHREAILGGAFDDCGFATHRISLAKGGVWDETPQASGLYRRASYRDLPSPIPSSLLFQGPEVDPPDEHYRVSSLRILTLEAGKWVVEIEGERRRKGEAIEVLHGARLHLTPEAIAAACLGGVGPTVAASWAVRTPRLLLEGLRLQA